MNFHNIWLMHEPGLNVPKIYQAIKAGPVEDAKRYGLKVDKVGSLGIVRTEGPMIKNAGWMAYYGVAGTRDTQAALMAAAQDADVKSILWVMDTPGGSVDGLEELARTVAAIAKTKEIVVQVDGMLASAGYYVAAQATQIIAGYDNFIGSIGTRTHMVDMSKLYEEHGVKVIAVDTGEHKSAGLEGTEVTDAHIAEMQKLVDGLFESFLAAIKKGRNITDAKLRSIADGRVFLSKEALSLGLIDKIQPLSATVAEYNRPRRRSPQSMRAAIAALDI